MRRYDLGPPKTQDIGDRAVDLHGTQLQGRSIALLVCGGIAAMKAPMIARALRRRGASVTAFVSKEAHRYVAIDALAWATNRPVVERLSPQAEHLSDTAPFDAYLVAPATYNTINKLAVGTADGLLTSTLASALGRMERGEAKVLIAPTMHGTMHNSILTASLRKLQDMGVRVVPPRDALGKDNLPEDSVLVAELCRALSRSALVGKRVLVTGGVVAADAGGGWGLRPPNSLSGVGEAISEELVLRGAEMLLLTGADPSQSPAWVPRRMAADAERFRSLLHTSLATGRWDALVMATAVPELGTAAPFRRPTAGEGLRIVSQPDLLEELRQRNTGLPMAVVGDAGLMSRAGLADLRLVLRPGTPLAEGGLADLIIGDAVPEGVQGLSLAVNGVVGALELRLA